MPRYATLLVIFALSSLGLPGTNSFVGEFLVLVGAFLWNKIAASLSALGVILAAVYLLWMVQRVAFGVPAERHTPHLVDLNWREMATFAPLVALVFWIGVFPNPLLVRMHAGVNELVERAERASTQVQGGNGRPALRSATCDGAPSQVASRKREAVPEPGTSPLDLAGMTP